MFRPIAHLFVRSHLRTAVVAAALLGCAVTATADDRDLLRKSSADPYVFILLDTSGSMHWAPKCTADDGPGDLDPNDGGCSTECGLGQSACERLCPNKACPADNPGCEDSEKVHVCVQPICTDGDCYTRLNGDDPSSKFYQAKEALYEVLRRVDNVYFGFSTYNQDQLRMVGKHWLYRLKGEETGVTLENGFVFPPAGSEQVFGRTFNCDTGGETTGHQATNPARLSDAWAMTRVRRCAQLGQTGTTSASSNRLIYLLSPGVDGSYGNADDRKYRIQFRAKAGETLGDDEVEVTLRLERCTNNDCSSRVFMQDREVKYTFLSDFNSWDNGATRAQRQQGYFSQANASDGPASNTCSGWDPNDDSTGDSTSDDFSGYNIKQPTVLHPTTSFRPTMNRGDIIPLDWTDRNRDEILARLAPNRLLGETRPDFRSARYFEDTLTSGILHLRNSTIRPLLAVGSTPLGNSLEDFQTWFQGFQSLAGARDPDWACRKKYILVLTDGDDTCNATDPCVIAPQLKTEDNVETIVVAFGIDDTTINGSNKLRCMATAALDLNGDGQAEDPAPFFPQNKDELVGILTDIFDNLTERPFAVASAAVPSVQANVKDKIFLSSFVPLNDASVWSGHIDAYLKPLPIDSATNTPDQNIPCTDTRRSRCHLWDAGEALVEQAPERSDVDAGNLALGNAEDQRRVFYPQAKNLITQAVPNTYRLLDFPTNATQRQDLWDAMGLNYSVGDLATDGTAVDNRAKDVLRETFVQKTGEVDTGAGTETITYVLGDIFHSNPTVIDLPDDFELTSRNEGGPSPPDLSCPSSDKGYLCYSRKHARRRKMLAVGANDGMMHLFDAGKYRSATKDFDNGTGKEIFAFAPRAVLPILKEVAEGERQIFSIDGSPRVANVFIDPRHSSSEPPRAADREWRTVLVGGLREGGFLAGGNRVQLDNGKPFTSAYFALDVTQPDQLNEDNAPINNDLVPSCLSEYSEGDCGPVPFGSELWEFTDSIDGSPSEWGVSLDEDNNDYPDFGDTWSQPVLGKLKIKEGDDVITKYVAIFGGGLDTSNRATPRRGTWLYMVDVETGATLYKRQLQGAVPATPAAIDVSGDGAIDAIFIGTTAGYLYKVDTSVPQPLEDVSVRDLNDATHDTQRITAEAWEPFKIFDTISSGARRPIFFQPTVVLVTEAGKYALFFGTGDREQLWNFDGLEGRLYAILDEDFRRGGSGLPLDEGDYPLIDAEAAALGSETNLLVQPNSDTSLRRGFILTLDQDERVLAQPFSVSGLTIFPTFKPQIVTDEDNVCARTGDSRIFVILTSNANPVLRDESGTKKRYATQGETLVTPPYVDQSATGNAPPTGDDPTPEPDEELIEELKKLFPGNCKFAGYTLEVNFLRSDTAVANSIPIPICIVSKNFKSL